ncbi:glucosaminidase domain-containing protein [bacterium]|nr:glucosaminidase domain-containing protein [bacterium]
MKINFTVLSFLLVFHIAAQNKSELYIKKYKDIAISEMNSYGIPASITLAQGILESGNGESRLAVDGNNHFGIKCHNNWNGETIIEDDDEKGECFRKYSNVGDSFRDHSLFLKERGRYEFLFKYKITNYKKWARGLKKAGYATNPKYASLLIDIIKKHNLTQYDNLSSDRKKIFLSNIYGAPYLLGFGINYFNNESFIDCKIQSSFVLLNKASLSYNKLLFKKIFVGVNSGVVFEKIDLKTNFGIQISHIYRLIEKRNKLQKITFGLDVLFDDVFMLNEIDYLPYISISFLF